MRLALPALLVPDVSGSSSSSSGKVNIAGIAVFRSAGLFVPKGLGSKSSGLKCRLHTFRCFSASVAVSSPNFGLLIARSHFLHNSNSLGNP